ncbi:MAG: putative inorganic carbon transporter subunit DabA, partial [Fulvivirga sp.]|nr:putative inorganic carbon transporter subunit DabA [Fulvivirga sp.]
MDLNKKINSEINNAYNEVAKVWPLYAFVTSNPLSNFEGISFHQAIEELRKFRNISGYPSSHVFQSALQNGDIYGAVIADCLNQHGFQKDPAYYLEVLAQNESIERPENEAFLLDQLTVKWLSQFLDEGLSNWPMPDREKGFYKAWRELAAFDSTITNAKDIRKMPEDPYEAVKIILKGCQPDEYPNIFRYHFAALPGWMGYIKYRIETHTDWQQKYPITAVDYLAVRLVLSKLLDLPLYSGKHEKKKGSDTTLYQSWLQAWEISWQKKLLAQLGNREKDNTHHTFSEPEAQMAFCIDTRSELIRRHVEQSGNYETFGYAGFFGIAMDYEDHHTGIVRKSCPPILDSAVTVRETCSDNDVQGKYDDFKNALTFRQQALRSMKFNIPGAFGFVEGAGPFYGFSLFFRTIIPKAINKVRKFYEKVHHEFEALSDQEIRKGADELSVEEKASMAQAAFKLLGWSKFAPVVMFVGHGSHTANNPFASSLDCGACAGSRGRNNARVLAKICNDDAVRDILQSQYNINIPDDTVFIG